MAEYISYTNGKRKMTLITPAEQLPAYRNFMLSEKEFRPNTPNALIGGKTKPVEMKSIAEAITAVRKEIDEFENYWKDKTEEHTLTNSFFGELNFEQQVHLLHKHSTHHLKQFGLIGT
jgi:hypothetical protein